MTEQEAVQESIEHWERMILWVDGLNNKNDRPNDDKMTDAIDESWYGEYCLLCKEFKGCQACPLKISFGVCTNDDSKNAWKLVRHSKTWKGWLKNANKMLKQIKSLEKLKVMI